MESKPPEPTEGSPTQGPSPESLGEEREILQRLTDVQAQQRLLGDKLAEVQSQGLEFQHKPNGAAAAAIIAASFGVFIIGLLTTLAAASGGIKGWLNWYSPTGPLSGKTTLGGIIWLVTWLGTHYLLKNKETNLTRFLQASAILLVLGLLLMFPLIFELFE